MSTSPPNYQGHIELISVALVVSPSDHHLVRSCVENIIAQEYDYKEIIIINNTSNLTLAANLDIEATRMVSIYDTEEDLPIGMCLNLAMHNTHGPNFIHWTGIRPLDHLSQMKVALDDYKADVVYATDSSGTLDIRSCLLRKHRDLYHSPIDHPFREFLDRAKNTRKLLYLPMKYKKTL